MRKIYLCHGVDVAVVGDDGADFAVVANWPVAPETRTNWKTPPTRPGAVVEGVMAADRGAPASWTNILAVVDIADGYRTFCCWRIELGLDGSVVDAAVGDNCVGAVAADGAAADGGIGD